MYYHLTSAQCEPCFSPTFNGVVKTKTTTTGCIRKAQSIKRWDATLTCPSPVTSWTPSDKFWTSFCARSKVKTGEQIFSPEAFWNCYKKQQVSIMGSLAILWKPSNFARGLIYFVQYSPRGLFSFNRITQKKTGNAGCRHFVEITLTEACNKRFWQHSLTLFKLDDTLTSHLGPIRSFCVGVITVNWPQIW